MVLVAKAVSRSIFCILPPNKGDLCPHSTQPPSFDDKGSQFFSEREVLTRPFSLLFY